MAKWKVYYDDIFPSCSQCGSAAPYERYTRKNGINARRITDYCPDCGAKMTAIDECADCPHSRNGEWQENGICFACRGVTWVYGKKQNARILEKD